MRIAREGKREREGEREGERTMTTGSILYYLKKDTRTAKRLKIGVEPNWFLIMPCASIYSTIKSTQLARMFL